MKIGFRDVWSDEEFPDVDVLHYFSDDGYELSVKDDVMFFADPAPLWPREVDL